MKLIKFIFASAVIAAASMALADAGPKCNHKINDDITAKTNPPQQSTASAQPASAAQLKSTYGKH